MESYIKTTHTEIWLQDGIIYTVHASSLTRLTLELAQDCVEKRLMISDGKSYPIFFDGTNISSIDADAKEYLSAGEAIKYISAGALLVNNHLQKMIANTFIILDRPIIPTKFFTNYDKAISWLNYYKNVN